MGISEDGTVGSQLVEMRSGDFRIGVKRADVPVTHIVCQDNENVGLLGGGAHEGQKKKNECGDRGREFRSMHWEKEYAEDEPAYQEEIFEAGPSRREGGPGVFGIGWR